MITHALAALCAAVAPAPTLEPLLYETLPLGTFKASGWLLRQLTQQANTLSGKMSLFWPDVNKCMQQSRIADL